MKQFLFFIFTVLLLGCYSSTNMTTSDLLNSKPLPFNPEIKKGKLNNGLDYYILKNSFPKNRVYIRLVVNAGSMHEDDDQKGIAHIVEHMAFNGTKKYPENQIISILETLGMKFARDINAFTDFENTVYTLNIADNNLEKLELSLDVINEWMNNLTIYPKDLDAERGIVLAEWRSRLSPMLRLGDKKSTIEMAGSRYVQRDPIGDVNIIKNVSAKRVKDFYKKWYRPDNMSIIIVGDIDENQVLNLVKQKLDLPNKQTKIPLEKINFDIPLINKWRLSSISEPRILEPSIELSFFHSTKSKNTVYEYKQDLIQQIVIRLINLRFQEWEKNQYTINSANFYHDYIGLYNLQSVFSLQLSDINYLENIRYLFKFIAEITQNGFSQEEFNSEIQSLLKINKKQKDIALGSLRIANDLVNIVATKQISLDPIYKFNLNETLLKEIKLVDLNEAFNKLINSDSRLLLITQPFPEKKLSFDLQKIENLWNDIIHLHQKPWENKVMYKEMPNLLLEKGSVFKDKYWNDENITEFKLSNGGKLIYHYSDKAPGQVYFKALTKGGLRSISQKDYHPLRIASNLIDESGIGELSQQEINKLFSQNPIVFSTILDDYHQGFLGFGKKEDLESLLKLFRLRLQSSSISQDIFEKFRKEELVNTNDNDKEIEFMRKLYQVRYPKYETIYSPKRKYIEKMNKKELEDIYKNYINNKTDFTYFLIGDIDEKRVISLAEEYLANIEIKKQKRKSEQLLITIPKKQLVVSGFKEPRAEVELFLTASNQWSLENQYLFDILADILQEKFRLELRERESGAYSVNVWFSQIPEQSQIEGKIEFSCEPERIDELLTATHKILDKILEEGIDISLIEKKIMERDVQIKQQFDSLLSIFGLIEQSYRITGTPQLLAQELTLSQMITKEKIEKVSKHILNPYNRFEAILKP